MKERPIIFNAEEVRAVLDGRKKMTRRMFKFAETNQPPSRPDMFNPKHVTQPPPFGTVGDRLWVRETWQAWRMCNLEYNEWDVCDCAPSEIYGTYGKPKVEYAATSDSIGPWRPSIHMPRWASRITLEITGVRVERLQEITEEDAFQEGAPSKAGTVTGPYCMSSKEGFRTLWQSIYGNWDSNPWVWVYEFRKLEGER